MKKNFLKAITLILCLIKMNTLLSMEQPYLHSSPTFFNDSYETAETSTAMEDEQCSMCKGLLEEDAKIFICNHYFCHPCILYEIQRHGERADQLVCPLTRCRAPLDPKESEEFDFLKEYAHLVLKKSMIKSAKRPQNTNYTFHSDSKRKVDISIYEPQSKPENGKRGRKRIRYQPRHLEAWAKLSLKDEHAKKLKLARFERRKLSYSPKTTVPAPAPSHQEPILSVTAPVAPMITIPQDEHEEGWVSMKCQTCDEINAEDYKLFDCSHSLCEECVENLITNAENQQRNFECPAADCKKTAISSKLLSLTPPLLARAKKLLPTELMVLEGEPLVTGETKGEPITTDTNHEIPVIISPIRPAPSLPYKSALQGSGQAKVLTGVAVSSMGLVGYLLHKHAFKHGTLPIKSVTNQKSPTTTLSYSKAALPSILSVGLFSTLTLKDINIANYCVNKLKTLAYKVGASSTIPTAFNSSTLTKHIVNGGLSVAVGTLTKYGLKKWVIKKHKQLH